MKKRVLIIDDELDLCFLMKSYLVSKSYEVDTANTLKEGMRKLNNQHPDIIFLDNNLPDGKGWEKASELSTDYPAMKINLISGFNSPSSFIKNKKNLSVFEKPLSPAEIDESLV
jgi:DNA-binding NtrC family response regulator